MVEQALSAHQGAGGRRGVPQQLRAAFIDRERPALAGADPGNLVGASMVVTYVHDRGPLVLPGSDRVYEPTGKDLVLNGSDTEGSP